MTEKNKEKALNITAQGSGLVCDNPECDYEDMSIGFEDYDKWINHPCPKCGENLLTQEDFDSSQMLLSTISTLNSMNPEEIAEIVELTKNIKLDDVKDLSILKDAEGLELLDEKDLNKPVLVNVKVHKGIKFTDIKTID